MSFVRIVVAYGSHNSIPPCGGKHTNEPRKDSWMRIVPLESNVAASKLVIGSMPRYESLATPWIVRISTSHSIPSQQLFNSSSKTGVPVRYSSKVSAKASKTGFSSVSSSLSQQPPARKSPNGISFVGWFSFFTKKPPKQAT